MGITFNIDDLRACLLSGAPVELKGMGLLREQPNLISGTGDIPREALVEAVTEIVEYTGRCAAAVKPRTGSAAERHSDGIRPMNAIMTTYAQLTAALTSDPLLLLASTVAVFDPFWDDFDEEIDYEVDPLTIALQVTRGAFPDIYAAAIEQMRAGAPYAELDRLLCKAITAKGIPLDDIEMMGWGIPLTAFGVDLEDLEPVMNSADELLNWGHEQKSLPQ